MATTDGDKLKYLQLQQDADFALWKTREGHAEVKKAYAEQAAGKGAGPSKEQLESLASLERDAEAKYRALRDFVRAFFD
jgi:hypothetical protein